MNKFEFKSYFDKNYKEFDGFLIDLGISKNHLDYIKTIKINNNIYPREYYDFIKQEHDVTIPTKKIKYTSLFGNYGYYWYDLIKDSFIKEPKDITANIKPASIWDCFRHLYEKGFEKWNESYLSKTVGGCNYAAFITSDGEIHYTHSGGNGGGRHRLFSAKVGGVENILAASLEIYKYNPLKARLFNQIQIKETEIKNHINNREYLEFNKDMSKIELKCSRPYFNYELGSILENKKTCFLNNEIDEIQAYIDNLNRYQSYFMQIDAIYDSIKNHRNIWPVFYIKNKLNKVKTQSNTHKFKSLTHLDEEHIPDEIVKEMKLVFSYNNKYRGDKYESFS